jgi:predicted transcriptional regulator
MKNNKPTTSELAILQILWENGPSSVRFVHEKLATNKQVGYTSTLKLMQIMFSEKGFLKRDTSARTHIYEAAISEQATQKSLLNKFVESTFRGSAMKMVMQTLGSHKASKEELEDIKALIEEIENNNKES